MLSFGEKLAINLRRIKIIWISYIILRLREFGSSFEPLKSVDSGDTRVSIIVLNISQEKKSIEVSRYNLFLTL